MHLLLASNVPFQCGTDSQWT